MEQYSFMMLVKSAPNNVLAVLTHIFNKSFYYWNFFVPL